MSVLLRRGTLWPALRARRASALVSGALEPLETALEEVEDGGIAFQLRLATSLRRKQAARAARPSDFDPFLPYERELFVADVSDVYVCLLNRFPVLPYHALLTTRAFEAQDAPLEARDFEAWWACLAERDALGFYNSAPEAGSSERHRHLQLVPPLVAGAAVAPVDAVLEAARFDGPVGCAPLPFLHAVARVSRLVELSIGEASHALAALTREMARAFGCDRPGRPYNLLLSRDWMLFVPRAREKWEGVSVNALGFAGTLLVRDRESLERVRAAGPLAVLRHVGVSA